MEIRIKRSPQHWCPSEGSNSEHFAHENDALIVRPQFTSSLHIVFFSFELSLQLKKTIQFGLTTPPPEFYFFHHILLQY